MHVEIQAHSCEFRLTAVNFHWLSFDGLCGFMRLHSDREIESMSREAILSFLQQGVRYLMYQFEHTTEEDLKAALTQFERNGTIWV